LEQLQDPLRNPRDNTWQLIGVIVTAIGVFVAIIPFPLDKMILALIVLFIGLIICILVIRRAKASSLSALSQNSSNTNLATTPKPKVKSNEKIKVAFYRSILITCLFAFTAITLNTLESSLYWRLSEIFPSLWVSRFFSIISYSNSNLIIILLFLDLLRRVFIVVHKGIIRNVYIIFFSLGVFLLGGTIYGSLLLYVVNFGHPIHNHLFHLSIPFSFLFMLTGVSAFLFALIIAVIQGFNYLVSWLFRICSAQQ
jgi:hypothetical protein